MRIKKTILAGLLLLPALTFSQVWNQVGADIDGETANDGSGNSVSLSADGTIVAIGAKENISGNGHTRVFQISSGSWNQIGLDIDGPGFENAGASVSLSADGLTLAVGSPFGSTFMGLARIYQFSAGTWSQVGTDINGTVSFGNTGSSLTLSSDGSTVAIDTQGANSSTGLVQVYQLISGVWTQVGADINGEATGDASGRSISLSNDGSIVAIGAPNNTSGTGHVRVYENVSAVWTQIGADIDGEAISDQSGGAVSLSADGSIVAIGATGNNNTGHVRVLNFAGGSWNQVGLDIDGVVSGEYFGTSVSLDNDGNTVVIGANELGNSQTGLTRVYKNVLGSWTQSGPDIVAESSADESGESVSISNDGLTVAIGAIANDGNGNRAGQVRVYNFFCSPSVYTDVQSACISYTWLDGNTYTADNNTATRTLTNAVGCDSIITLDLTINVLDIATTNINGTITSSATGATYQWLDCDNAYSIIVGQTSQSFIVTNTGNYAVEVTQNSCTDTSVCINATVASVNDIERNIVSIYPNPTKELINIDFGNIQGIVNYTLTSIEGKIIEQKQNIADKVISIDLSYQTKGIYILTIDNNSSINTYKIVRE
jgi:hypothetical protein